MKIKSRTSNSQIIASAESYIEKYLECSTHYEKIRSVVQSLYGLPLIWDSGQHLLVKNKINSFEFSFQKSKESIIILSILSNYMDPNVAFILKLDLQEAILQIEGSEDLFLLSERRSIMWNYIFTSTRFNNRYLGSLIDDEKFDKYFNSLHFRKDISSYLDPVSEPIRRKGYKDKGTTADPSQVARRLEVQNDIRFQRQQYLRESYHDNIQFFIQLHRSALNGLESNLLSDNYYFDYKKGIIHYVDERLTYRKDFEEKGRVRKAQQEKRELRSPDFFNEIEDRESGIYSFLHTGQP